MSGMWYRDNVRVDWSNVAIISTAVCQVFKPGRHHKDAGNTH